MFAFVARVVGVFGWFWLQPCKRNDFAWLMCFVLNEMNSGLLDVVVVEVTTEVLANLVCITFSFSGRRRTDLL